MSSLRPIMSRSNDRAGRVVWWTERVPHRTGLCFWALQSHTPGDAVEGWPPHLQFSHMGSFCPPLPGRLWGVGIINVHHKDGAGLEQGLIRPRKLRTRTQRKWSRGCPSLWDPHWGFWWKRKKKKRENRERERERGTVSLRSISFPFCLCPWLSVTWVILSHPAPAESAPGSKRPHLSCFFRETSLLVEGEAETWRSSQSVNSLVSRCEPIASLKPPDLSDTCCHCV